MPSMPSSNRSSRTTWGWRGGVAGVTFLGRPVELRVDTEPEPTGGPPPPLDETELVLVRLVLPSLSALIPEIEAHYRGHADSPAVLDSVSEPRVWLSRDILADDGPGRWGFVAGLTDAPDWVIHAEFDGLVFREIWSGD
jgi:hypothetical protein